MTTHHEQRLADAALCFICSHTGMEGSSPLHFKKEEIDRAAKDKTHKLFPANFAMQVHFVELPAMQKHVIYHEDVFDTGAAFVQCPSFCQTSLATMMAPAQNFVALARQLSGRKKRSCQACNVASFEHSLCTEKAKMYLPEVVSVS